MFASEPQANPLKEWYEGLDKLLRDVPNDVLVLPSHNEPFYGLHERLDSLRSGQNSALNRLRQTLTTGPQRIIDTFAALFHRSIGEQDAQQLSLATGEAVACINFLIAQATIEVTMDENGVAWHSTRY